MSRIGRLAIPVPAGVEVDHRRRNVTVKGPKGTLPRADGDMRVVQEDGTCGSSGPTTEAPRRAPRADPHARQQHGRRRHRPATARASRSPVSAIVPQLVGREAPAQPGLQPPDRDRSAAGHQLRGREPHPARRPRASTRSSSARSPPASARRASPSRTRARASATRRGDPPQGRQGRQDRRQEVSAAERGAEGHRMTAPISRGAARQKRHARASASPARARRRGRDWRCSAASNHIYAQVIDDPSGRTLAAPRRWRRSFAATEGHQDRRRPHASAGSSPSGPGCRGRAGRLRPCRVPVPRADQVARRCRPRSRPRLLGRSRPWHGSIPTS